MKNFFINELHLNEFSENGFIVLDFLDKNDVESLKNIYNQNNIPDSEHFYSTSFLPSDKKRAYLSQEIQKIIGSKANNIFRNHQELGAVFLIKSSGENSQMPIHQDWTVVEEPENHSITIWIPLIDTTEQNGAITVLPKSHRLSTGLRSPSIQDPLQDIKELARPMMHTLEMKAGQAFIFSHALLHASHSNTSGESRIAVAYGLIHQETDLIYYHKPSTDAKVQKLSIPKDFFISYPEPGKAPANSTLIEEIVYDERKISVEDFKKFYNLLPKTLWSRVKAFWS
jgi:hypothetical protein